MTVIVSSLCEVHVTYKASEWRNWYGDS